MNQDNKGLDLFLLLAMFNTALRLDDISSQSKSHETLLEKLDEIAAILHRIEEVNLHDKN